MYGKINTGNAIITKGNFGKLKCKYIIQAVGPAPTGKLTSKDINDLMNVTTMIFKLAEEKQIKSISIPAVSSGIFGFPKEKCAKIMTIGIINHLEKYKGKTSIKEVRFTNIDELTCDIFKKELESIIDKLIKINE